MHQKWVHLKEFDKNYDENILMATTPWNNNLGQSFASNSQFALPSNESNMNKTIIDDDRNVQTSPLRGVTMMQRNLSGGLEHETQDKNLEHLNSFYFYEVSVKYIKQLSFFFFLQIFNKVY